MSQQASYILTYAAKRLAALVPLFLVITFIVFVALEMAPGDPVQLLLGQNASPEATARLEQELGLDRPLIVQWGNFVLDAVRGDLGTSYRTDRDVVSEILRTGSVSAVLAVIAMAISITVGVTVGIVAAVKQYSLWDNLLRVGVLAGVSMPVFWLGLMLIVLFSVNLGWLPAFGWDSWAHLVLPAITLSTFPLAVIARLTRSSMLEVLRADYVRVARANGLPNRWITLRYALKNALIPVVTIVGLQFGALIAGAILTETVFGIPGLGRLTVTAILARDYPIVRGAVLFGTLVFVMVNLFVDLLYIWIDPRQRTARA